MTKVEVLRKFDIVHGTVIMVPTSTVVKVGETIETKYGNYTVTEIVYPTKPNVDVIALYVK